MTNHDQSQSTPAPATRAHMIVILAVFMIGIAVPKALMALDGFRSWLKGCPIDVQFLIHPVFRMTIVTIGWMVIVRSMKDRPWPTMGLLVGWRQGIKGFAIGFACTLPMLALGLMGSGLDVTRYLLYTTFAPGLTEEIFYRAFAFGLLVQVAQTRYWPTAIGTGILFGLAHVNFSPPAGVTILEQLGPWIWMIALGGVLYAWIYERSDWNLWAVISLHFGMNLWWGMYDLADTPMGVLGATMARIIAVGLAIYFIVFLGVLRKPAPSTIPA